MGEIAGGMFAVFILSFVLDMLLVGRLVAEPASSLMASVIAAALLAAILYSFLNGLSNRTGSAWLAYMFGAVPAYFLRRWSAPKDEEGNLT